MHLPLESITTTLEVATLNQLVSLFNLPLDVWGIGAAALGHDSDSRRGGSGSGIFTTGATASNILGLAMGREWVLSQAAKRKIGLEMSCAEHGVYETMTQAGVREVVVLSSLPHSSISKAAAVVGLGRGCVRSVRRRGTACGIDLEVLKREVGVQGRVCVVVVSAGEVNTGRFAEGMGVMREARRICDEVGAWLHVDGAFGLFARVLQGEKGFEDVVRGVEGVELADSITGDGHKLLNVPYDCGFFFTRHRALAEEVFSNGSAAYLTSGMNGDGDGIQSPLNIGLENSRRFRALPVHATLTAYGREGYVDMLKRQVGLARRVTKWLKGRKEYEVLPRGEDVEETIKQTFMIVLFRAKDDEINTVLAKRINATGKMYVTGTKWEGETAVRIAISNWQVDIERDFRLIEEVLDEVVI